MLFGISKWITVTLASAILILISRAAKYRRVELIAIFVGLFELVFIPAAIFAKPDLKMMLSDIFGKPPLNNNSFLLLIAANVGAVIMPWMVFYQQGAVVDKGLKVESINHSRIDTSIGSVITQIIMIAVLVLTAATIGKVNPNTPLESVQQIANTLTPFLGNFIGRVLFAVGITGAALIAMIVVVLAMSWAFSEVIDAKCSLNCTWGEAPIFYGLYCGVIVVSSLLIMTGLPLVALAIGVEIMNSLLLPVVLGFLLVLAWKVLPEPYTLKLWEKIGLIIVYIIICLLGLVTIVQLLNKS